MTYFYARVSTKDQNLDRQLDKASKLGIDGECVYAEKQSGKNTAGRPEWNKLNKVMVEGDTLVVSSLSRLSRSLKDIMTITADLTSRGITVSFQKENIDTSTATGRMMLGVIGSVYEFEREMIVERVQEGVQVSRKKREAEGTVNASGNVWGGNTEKDLTEDQRRVLKLWMDKTIKTAEAMAMLDCTRQHLYNLKKKM